MTESAYQSTIEDIRLAQAGDAEAMERLVTANDALVRFVVKRYAGSGKEYEDLYQLGRLGLVRAAQNFREDFGSRFSTYAVPMIMGEIRRFLRDDGQLRVSRTIRDNAKKLMKRAEEMRGETGAEARIEDLCAQTGISREEAALALGALCPVRSLSEPIDAMGETELGDMLGENPFETVENRLLVRNLMDSLDEKERTLIELRYFCRLTQTRVAGIMGLTQVQVSRLEKKLLTRMRRDAV